MTAVQHILNILNVHCHSIDLHCNANKTVCILFVFLMLLVTFRDQIIGNNNCVMHFMYVFEFKHL